MMMMMMVMMLRLMMMMMMMMMMMIMMTTMMMMERAAALTPLEVALIEGQRARPGCLDGRRLRLDSGEPHEEARIGANPLAHGYCVCAPA